MNFCEKYSDLIQDLLEDELDEHQTAKTESHLLACQKCRKQYETLRQAKEIYAHYLFDAEPSPDSWANFEARLVSENEKAMGEKVVAVNRFRRPQRIFGFGFSPAMSAGLAAVLFVCGIGFVLLPTESGEKTGDKYVARMENSPRPTQSNESGEKPAANSPAQTIATEVIPGSNDLLAENKPLKAKSNSLLGKKSSAETVKKNNRKPASSSDRRKSAGDVQPGEEKRLPALQAQNLEMEIAGQMEKVELLLRSFRNAQSDETTEGFDVEYEKRQARKLLDVNSRLKRSAENYGLSYAEELLSLVEPHLLEIANLETNPSTDRVLDIRDRVSSQNIIASLQAYSRDATQ